MQSWINFNINSKMKRNMIKCGEYMEPQSRRFKELKSNKGIWINKKKFLLNKWRMVKKNSTMLLQNQRI